MRLCRQTLRWSGRVRDKMTSSNAGVRAARLNRCTDLAKWAAECELRGSEIVAGRYQRSQARMER